MKLFNVKYRCEGCGSEFTHPVLADDEDEAYETAEVEVSDYCDASHTIIEVTEDEPDSH